MRLLRNGVGCGGGMNSIRFMQYQQSIALDRGCYIIEGSLYEKNDLNNNAGEAIVLDQFQKTWLLVRERAVTESTLKWSNKLRKLDQQNRKKKNQYPDLES